MGALGPGGFTSGGEVQCIQSCLESRVTRRYRWTICQIHWRSLKSASQLGKSLDQLLGHIQVDKSDQLLARFRQADCGYAGCLTVARASQEVQLESCCPVQKHFLCLSEKTPSNTHNLRQQPGVWPLPSPLAPLNIS